MASIRRLWTTAGPGYGHRERRKILKSQEGAVVHSIAQTVALHRKPDDVLRAAVEVSRELLGTATFAALPDDETGFTTSLMSGIRDPRFGALHVVDGRGLGGQVLLSRRPMAVEDYSSDPRISRDFVDVVVHAEGLSSLCCVPVLGPAGVEALLYAGVHGMGTIGDVALTQIENVARYAEIGLYEIEARERDLELERLRERERLATQLHDSVAQMLFAIGVAAQYSRDQRDPDTLLATIGEIEATAAEARSELRDAIHRLGDSPEEMAFEARLDGELALFERTSGCTVRVARAGTPRALPEPAERLILETALEGLRNAVKYAAAKLAVVFLRYAPGGVVLTVQTELVGSLRLPADGSGTGAGLAQLKRRAEQLRGDLALTTDDAELKVLRLELPA